MRVIFLDFDGVINNCGEMDDYVFYPVTDREGNQHMLPFSARNIAALKMLFDFLFKENIKIVISTSWRQIISYNEVNRVFKDFFGFAYVEEDLVVNETPHIYEFLEVIRGNEIKKFLKNNKGITDYLIIDDCFDFLKNQKSHIILTDASAGFTEEDFQKVKKYFLKNSFGFELFK